MQTIPSKEAKDRFGAFLDTVQHEPVAITNHGRRVAVTISARDFEELGGDEAILKLQQERFRKKAQEKGFSSKETELMLGDPKEGDVEKLIAVKRGIQKQAIEAGLTQGKLNNMLEEISEEMYGKK